MGAARAWIAKPLSSSDAAAPPAHYSEPSAPWSLQGVSRHWRTALRSLPGAFSSLSLSGSESAQDSSCFRQPTAQEAAAAEARALGRLAALTARKPVVGTIELDLSQSVPSRQLKDAYMTTIEALLSVQVGTMAWQLV